MIFYETILFKFLIKIFSWKYIENVKLINLNRLGRENL